MNVTNDRSSYKLAHLEKISRILAVVFLSVFFLTGFGQLLYLGDRFAKFLIEVIFARKFLVHFLRWKDVD